MPNQEKPKPKNGNTITWKATAEDARKIAEHKRALSIKNTSEILRRAIHAYNPVTEKRNELARIRMLVNVAHQQAILRELITLQCHLRNGYKDLPPADQNELIAIAFKNLKDDIRKQIEAKLQSE